MDIEWTIKHNPKKSNPPRYLEAVIDFEGHVSIEVDGNPEIWIDGKGKVHTYGSTQLLELS